MADQTTQTTGMMEKSDDIRTRDYALINAGWIITVDPPAATMGTGIKFYSLPSMPGGLLSTAKFERLIYRDARTVQDCIEKLQEKKS